MVEGYSFKQYDLADLRDLSNLYSLVMGRNGDVNYFDWKYRQNPAGLAVCTEARSEGGQLAAFYGMVPERYEVGEEQVTVYQGCDLMTHPDHRGKRLFPAVFTACAEAARAGSDRFNFIGFGGANTLSGYRRLGLKFPVWTKQLVKPVAPFALSDGTEEELAYADPLRMIAQMEKDIRHSTSGEHIQKLLDYDVLSWKAGNSQRDYHYVIVDCGFAIISKMGSRAQLVHARSASPKGTKDLSRRVSQWARSENVRFLLSTANENSEFRDLLSAMGYWRNPFKKGPLSESVPLMTLTIGDIDLNTSRGMSINPIYFDSY